MGVVYKAEDTNLGRPVALKFLPSHLLGDEEVKRRFQREAKAAAALDHPNLCYVHEIDEADGKTFIAMSLIEGEPLDTLISKGPLKLDQALDIAQHVSKGLEAAHKRGIVHRDIKPENIMVDDDGHVTIMDFGLAQLNEASRLTRTDETVGTVAYMSPEQTDGSGTDHRSDIWSLGVVLYEMITGQKPFKGDYDKAVMYSILNEKPEPMTALRTGVPMELELAVNKTLAKSPEHRYQGVSELSVDLRTLAAKPTEGQSRVMASPPSQVGGQRTLEKLYLAGFVAMSIIALFSVDRGFLDTSPSASEPRPVRKFTFIPEEPLAGSHASVSISPNGKHIAYVTGTGNRTLRVLDLSSGESREIADITGGLNPFQGAFWSPDSAFLAFGSDMKLKKVSVNGGPATILCDLFGNIWEGGSWSRDGDTIVFSSGAVGGGGPQMWELPARGGEPKLLENASADRDGMGDPQLPFFLPPPAKQRTLLQTHGYRAARTLEIVDLETGDYRELGKGAFPVYAPSGHVVYQTDLDEAGIWALPIALDASKSDGEAFPIAEAAASPSVSRDGTLVYVDFYLADQTELVWRDRTGKKMGTGGRHDGLRPQRLHLAPDGRHAAVQVNSGGNLDVWVYDLDRAIGSRLTFQPQPEWPGPWSPSGTEIAYASGAIQTDIFVIASDGNGAPTKLVGSELDERALDWSADGKYILYLTQPSRRRRSADLHYLELKEGDSFESSVFLATPFDERSGQFSPDGRFVAYQSDESGQEEVYVRSFPDASAKTQISTDGGGEPRWRADGKELFYLDLEDASAMAVTVDTQGEFSSGPPTKLFDKPALAELDTWHVVGEGPRFLNIEGVRPDPDTRQAIRIVENWYEEFRDHE